jgi:uncharacterized Zn finger protein
METEFEVQCPYCGESIWVEFFPEDGFIQETIMDCGVCCSPFSFKVKFDHQGSAEVLVERSN